MMTTPLANDVAANTNNSGTSAAATAAPTPPKVKQPSMTQEKTSATTSSSPLPSPTRKKGGFKALRLPRRMNSGKLRSNTASSSSLPVATPLRENSSSNGNSNGKLVPPLEAVGATSSKSPGLQKHQLPDCNFQSNNVAANDAIPSMDSTVEQLELYLRGVALLGLAYLLGVHHPQGTPYVTKLGEYVGVAWLTCVAIKLSATYQRWKNCAAPLARSNDNTTGAADAANMTATAKTAERTIPSIERDLVVEEPPEIGSIVESDSIVSGFADDSSLPLSPPNAAESASASTTPRRPAVHPALEPFYIIETKSNTRIYPNEINSPFKLDNDLLHGEMVVLIRTPDVDDPQAPSGTPANQRVSDFFRDKKRRFEFQFQFKLKRIPQGRVYFAAEFEEAFKIGMVQRAFVSAAMAFVRTTNKTFHYSITGSKESPDGKYELPHMAFPVEEGMNRIIISKPGDTIPTLGGELEESEEDFARRKKGERIDPELGVTYTMSLWSAYCDYLQWKCINLPGIRPFKLSGVVGTQPVRITLYDIDENAEKHYRKDVNPVLELEMSNTTVALGRSARRWIHSQRMGGVGISNSSPSVGAGSTSSELQRDRSSTDDFHLLPGESILENVEEEEEGGDIDDSSTVSDEEAVAELGQGIYVRSGDKLTLRESYDETPGVAAAGDSVDGSCFLSAGGGFAVLQEQSSATIVIEKAERRNRRSGGGHELIRSGDAVRFKLVTPNRKGDGTDTKYLTIHRGWWLKWASAPSKTSNFVIHTHETEFSAGEGETRASETQSSFLTIGGSFWLGHKRWSKFLVGVASEESATYGGRMLGLYSAKDGGARPPEESALSDEGEGLIEMDQHPIVKAGREKGNWVRPLQLRAYESYSSTVAPGLTIKTDVDDVSVDEVIPEKTLVFSCDDHRMDAPVWLEIMNRVDRARQLVYAVRVLPPEDNSGSDEEAEDYEAAPDGRFGAFFRLRTGSDLAQLMRVGLNWRNSKVRDSTMDPPPSPTPEVAESPSKQRNLNTPRSMSSLDCAEMSYEEDSDNSEWELEGDEGDSTDEEDESVTRPRKSAKRRQLIGKFAKSVKRRGTSTGKTVVRQSLKVGKGTVSVGKKAIITPSVKVGKGTVSAGKAIIAPIRSKNPPLKNEPKSRKTGEKRARKKQERALRSAVSRSMRRIASADSKATTMDSPSFLAGELSAAEQSCRTVSKMLSSMSDVPRSSAFFTSFTELLAEQVAHKSGQDTTFLQGDAVHLGVVPYEGILKGPVLHGCVVARCLWESHWREEWCGLYEKSVELYTPMSSSSCLEISYRDIRSVRTIDVFAQSPLPGCPMLVIETAWQCHYLAFSDDSTLETFRSKIEESHTKTSSFEKSSSSLQDEELATARFWQGFQNTMESSLSGGKGKWAEVAVGKRYKRRTVLNRRRMEFDLEYLDTNPETLVSELLASSLSFSTEDPDALVRFLDSTSYLRLLNINDMNLRSPRTMCTFVNLYHCLLQHTLLISANGALSKRNYELIMRTSCYEMGGDVFSLAELLSMIRGNLTKPVYPKPPFVEVPKKSRSYRYYALVNSTPVIHFALHRGHSVMSPATVAILRPKDLEATLHRLAVEHVRRNLQVDMVRKTIFLPKVCEVFKSDFADHGAASSVLQYCLGFLDQKTVALIGELQRVDGTNISIKYQPVLDQYYTHLKPEDDDFYIEEEGEEEEEEEEAAIAAVVSDTPFEF